MKKSFFCGGLFLTVLLILLVILPRLGYYDKWFDSAEYPEITLNIKKPINDLDQLTPKTRELCLAFLEKAQEQGLKVRIVETYRPQERQDYLYEQGRSRAGGIVTWTKNSKHTSRRAFDIVQNIRGKEYNDADFFEQCAVIGRSLGLIAGHDWEEKDSPHFEYRPWWERLLN